MPERVALQAKPSLTPSPRTGRVEEPLRTLDPEAVEKAKARGARPWRGAAIGTTLGDEGADSAVEAQTNVFGNLNERGLAMQPNLDPAVSGIVPADATGSIGTNHYVEMVNGQVAVYDRTDLSLVNGNSLLDFVGTFGTGPSAFTPEVAFDPQVMFDAQSNRWFYVAVVEGREQPGAGLYRAGLVFGFSKSGDPTDIDVTDGASSWCNYFSETTASAANDFFFEDYPKLGDRDDAFMFGTNAWTYDTATGQTGDFVTARIWAIRKPAPVVDVCPRDPLDEGRLFGSAANPLLTSDGGPAFTPVPANTTDGFDLGYVVAADYPDSGSAGQIMVWRLGRNTNPTARFWLYEDGNVDVTTYSIPGNVPQPNTQLGQQLGGTLRPVLDTLDTRITQAVAHADRQTSGAETVWLQHTVSPSVGGRSVVRWYQLRPDQCANQSCPSSARRQEGTIQDQTDYVFNGAISPAGSGTQAAINYNVGGGTRRAEIRAQSRNATTPLNQMTGELTLDTSVASNQDFSCFVLVGNPPVLQAEVCRWGDYAAASPDPSNRRVVWGSNQTIGAPHSADLSANVFDAHWRTRNFAIEADPSPPTASIAVSANPVLTLSPVSLDGSGSFDADGEAIVRYEWDLNGDGLYDDTIGAGASRAFSRAGVYTVGLRIVAATGLAATATATVQVLNRGPTAGFRASPNPAQIRFLEGGVTVRFDASTSADPDGSVASYKWDLDGNGTFETDTAGSATASKSYSEPGPLKVKLQVTDNNGAAGEAALDLLVGKDVVIPSVARDWDWFKRYTIMRALAARNVEKGGRVEVRCRGRGCPYKRRARRVRRDTRRLTLHKAFRNRKLRVGTVIEVLVDNPRSGQRRWRFKIRSNASPTVRCTRPGSPKFGRDC